MCDPNLGGKLPKKAPETREMISLRIQTLKYFKYINKFKEKTVTKKIIIWAKKSNGSLKMKMVVSQNINWLDLARD